MDHTASFKLWKRGQKLGEGTFGEVYVATHEKTGEVAALKKIKLECEDEGVPGTTLREVSLLMHPNVVQYARPPARARRGIGSAHVGDRRPTPLARVRARRLKDVFYMPNENKLYLCFEYCEFDLKKYMKSQQYKLSADCIKSFTYMMLAGLSWCHSHRIFHRDLKPQNVRTPLRADRTAPPASSSHVCRRMCAARPPAERRVVCCRCSSTRRRARSSSPILASRARSRCRCARTRTRW
jgi:hypothetical protein